MPKRERKVTCPRCHRSISEGKLAEHIRQHKGKLPPHLRTTRVTKPKKREPSAPLSIPSYKEFFKQRFSKMPIKSNLPREQIHSKFKKSLADVATKYKSLKLESTEEPETIEVFIDEQRNITLKYNPLFLRTKTEEVVDALLLHEACHVATLLDSLIRVPEIGDGYQIMFMADYLTNYDEYLAHIEFVNKFKQNKRFEDLKQRQISLFENFETIIDSTRTILNIGTAKGLQINPFKVLQQLHSIAYDALFFYVAEDDSFMKWCKELGFEELHVFIGWQFEDFGYIRSLGLTREETRKKVIPSGILSLSVDPIKLVIDGKIKFADTTKRLHEEMIQKRHDTDLVELWENRRLLYEKM